MRLSERTPLSAPSKPLAAGPVNLIVTVLLPWLVFSLIVCLFSFAHQDFAPLVWALVVSSLLLSVLFVAMGVTAKRPLLVVLGFLILMSVGFSIPVGIFIEARYMIDFWRVDNGASYRQVSASDPSSSHFDASLLEFVPGTKVDAQHSVGYMKRGIVYCVAPVVGSKAPSAGGPEYWATGTDCCAQQGGFSCGEAGVPHALSGIVVPDEHDNFATAVRMAASTHSMQTPGGRLVFLEWTSSGLNYKESLWSNAALLVVVSSTVQFGICSCAGLCAARMKV